MAAKYSIGQTVYHPWDSCFVLKCTLTKYVVSVIHVNIEKEGDEQYEYSVIPEGRTNKTPQRLCEGDLFRSENEAIKGFYKNLD